MSEEMRREIGTNKGGLAIRFQKRKYKATFRHPSFIASTFWKVYQRARGARVFFAAAFRRLSPRVRSAFPENAPPGNTGPSGSLSQAA